MKKIVNTLLIAAALGLGFGTEQSYAGPGHDGHSHSHDIDANGAKQNGAKIVDKLVGKNKIATSWKGLEASSVEKKQFGKNLEWVVTFKNPKETDTSKQTLYIFLSLEGRYIAANFTGQ